MKLYGLTPQLNSKFGKYAGRYNIDLKVLAPAGKLNKVIVLGDGTPDDLALFMASHHLNGSETIAIIKPPEKRGTAIFGLIPTNLSGNRSLSKQLFILDQEQSSLECITQEFEKQVRRYFDKNYQCTRDEFEGRLKVFNCHTGTRDIELILVLNGHSEINTHKHMIEDHFLRAASTMGLLNLAERIDDPKDYWQTKVNEDSRTMVIKQLAESEKTLEIFFPQQMEGCRLLKS